MPLCSELLGIVRLANGILAFADAKEILRGNGRPQAEKSTSISSMRVEASGATGAGFAPGAFVFAFLVRLAAARRVPRAECAWLMAHGRDKSRPGDYGLLRERDRLRTLVSNAAKCGQSCSVMAVNFNPSPSPGSKCRTIASALICPPWTRKSTLAFIPTGCRPAVAMNRPPAPRSRTRETSSLPSQRQQTQTPSGVSTREVWRRE